MECLGDARERAKARDEGLDGLTGGLQRATADASLLHLRPADIGFGIGIVSITIALITLFSIKNILSSFSISLSTSISIRSSTTHSSVGASSLHAFDRTGRKCTFGHESFLYSYLL